MRRVLSLFAGIGGFDLGLERTGGFKTVAFCEIDPFCRRVLAKHWPEVPCYDDVRTLTADRLREDGIGVDCIVGGFPCQDISTAGLGAGIEGERSGLWSEYARLIGELRPQIVIVENVAALLARGLDKVLGDLAALGYDAEWDCIPASAVGAPHRRDRLWIIAEPADAHRDAVRVELWRGGRARGLGAAKPPEHGDNGTLADPQGLRCRQGGPGGAFAPSEMWPAEGSALAHSYGERGRCGSTGLEDAEDARQPSGRTWGGQWDAEPDVGRVAHGVPSRVDRLRSLGNAVLPQIPELIGLAILARDLNPLHQVSDQLPNSNSFVSPATSSAGSGAAIAHIGGPALGLSSFHAPSVAPEEYQDHA